jgi:hypothetical protein
MDYILKKIRFLYKEQGILGPTRALGRKIYYYGIRIPGHFFSYLWAVTIRRKRFPTFAFEGKTYDYLCSYKNFAWLSERTAEVPIAAGYMRDALAKGSRVLEVGDVLRQYTGLRAQDIVDKYEYRKGIINEDIEEFVPKERYDFIVSVSTMEHVGWDAPDIRDPEKSARVMRLFKDKFLTPGGMGVITLPVGQNPELDKRLRAHALPFTETYFLKRISKENEWVETDEADAFTKKYHSPFPNANAIVIGIIRAEGKDKA